MNSRWPQSRTGTITPQGEYDLATAGWLVAQIDLALLAGVTAVVVDLDELDFGGSTLVNDILRSRKRCTSRGVTFAVNASSARWHRLFRIAAVSDLLDART